MNNIYLPSLNSSRTFFDSVQFPQNSVPEVRTSFKCVVCIRSSLILLRTSKCHWWDKAISSTYTGWNSSAVELFVFRVTANTSAKHDKAHHVLLNLSPCLWSEGLQGLPDTHCGKKFLPTLGIPYSCRAAHAQCNMRGKGSQVNCRETAVFLWWYSGTGLPFQFKLHIYTDCCALSLCTEAFIQLTFTEGDKNQSFMEILNISEVINHFQGFWVIPLCAVHGCFQCQ